MVDPSNWITVPGTNWISAGEEVSEEVQEWVSKYVVGFVVGAILTIVTFFVGLIDLIFRPILDAIETIEEVLRYGLIDNLFAAPLSMLEAFQATIESASRAGGPLAPIVVILIWTAIAILMLEGLSRLRGLIPI